MATIENVIMSTGKDINKVSSIIKLDMVIRGSYLANVIPIEEIVKDIIAHHFCRTVKEIGIVLIVS
jgi:hypothetical protein